MESYCIRPEAHDPTRRRFGAYRRTRNFAKMRAVGTSEESTMPDFIAMSLFLLGTLTLQCNNR
jgi:hypothetical protein